MTTALAWVLFVYTAKIVFGLALLITPFFIWDSMKHDRSFDDIGNVGRVAWLIVASPFFAAVATLFIMLVIGFIGMFMTGVYHFLVYTPA